MVLLCICIFSAVVKYYVYCDAAKENNPFSQVGFILDLNDSLMKPFWIYLKLEWRVFGNTCVAVD